MLGVFNPLLFEGLNTPTTKPMEVGMQTEEVTDNRYRKEWAPEDAKVAYGARWIDSGYGSAEPVVDRQGWKCTDEADRDLLLPAIGVLNKGNVRYLDFVENVDGYYECDAANVAGAKVSLFVNGGYVHIEIWI